MYIHLFSFYVQVSSERTLYVIDTLVTISQAHYNNLLLGKCLKNMGVQYRSKDFQDLEKIRRRSENPRYKVGRICTREENISKEEIQKFLASLGYNIASIYITGEDIQNILDVFHDKE